MWYQSRSTKSQGVCLCVGRGFKGGRNSLISARGSSQIASLMHLGRSKVSAQETGAEQVEEWIRLWLLCNHLTSSSVD